MNTIVFIDTEIDPTNGNILDIGGIREDKSSFHSRSISDLNHFLDGSQFICGHNIFNHDLKYLQSVMDVHNLTGPGFIDTLYFAPLLFPTHSHHHLLKDDKLQPEEANNPLNDSIKARDLFFEETTAFQELDDQLRRIFYSLLKDKEEFGSFFKFLDYQVNEEQIEKLIRERFQDQICDESNLTILCKENPIELAYGLALMTCPH